ncbi:MAG: glutamate synthase subunit alpha, partial [bacterium]|nr:glutamate synthase subunit alpha [bacterium]
MARNASPYRINASGVPKPTGLYDPKNDHDSCGVGFIARIDGVARHLVVEQGIRILVNLEHRGALGGDKSTGDGAGILLSVPDTFFRQVCPGEGFYLPAAGEYAAGSVFLPMDEALAERCSAVVARISAAEGCPLLGWREVPVDPSILGDLSRSTRPRIRQVFLSRGVYEGDAFERKLYVVRRLVEKEVASWQNVDASQFYICSLSARTIVYKGLLTGSQLPLFYPDLKNEHFMSPYAVVHQRYSTNTLPTWHLAHPFRLAAHNGEINTLRGNI